MSAQETHGADGRELTLEQRRILWEGGTDLWCSRTSFGGNIRMEACLSAVALCEGGKASATSFFYTLNI